MKADTVDGHQITDGDIGRVTSRVRQLCTRHRLRHEDTEDVVQECLLELVRFGARYDGSRQPWPVALHRRVAWWVVNAIRRRLGREGSAKSEAERHGKRSMEYLKDSGLEPSRDGLEAAAETRDLVERGLSRVSPRERRVLTAIFVEGRTLADVGQELGVSKERVRQIRVRALGRAREAVTVTERLHRQDAKDAKDGEA